MPRRLARAGGHRREGQPGDGPTSRSALIEAGCFGPDLEAQLRPHGLTLRHYPQSFCFATLGGRIATRAGGHCATQATRIDAFVQISAASGGPEGRQPTSDLGLPGGRVPLPPREVDRQVGAEPSAHGIEHYAYKEYSAPWFGCRKVLEGGSWATRPRFAYTTLRNFFPPHRHDVYAGFRTCARD